ncbi:reverse transcriptase family protein [Sphingobium sp. B12D2B]|uniref:reverse transcriptase family protein n=1 Tax=Sphingobium sp. B12D2B TaxID=2940577 RepID=UPI002225450E|nr:reverse transcriptase family protein [Sphingobium sp. B12D2B]MCW2351103.1 hypothetical protein [Sphingobium sp. B12D2B]
MKRRRNPPYERYLFEHSPWVQNLTQRDLANLLGFSKDQLEALIRDKNMWISRRNEMIGGKPRRLAVPFGKLRGVHERLKFHLNKIKQPDYLFSPRKGRGQRDNAERHVGQVQFLSLDIRQFYPSTTSEHIFRWAHHEAGLKADVAGMLVHLIAVDGRMPFGSPISPVLTALVHRRMFDAIKQICDARGLQMSLWVDDLTISGREVRGEVVDEIRAQIRKSGFDTHKIHFRTANRPVVITGVPIQGGRVMAPRKVHDRIRAGYSDLRASNDDGIREQIIDRLLSALGTYRYHVGRGTPEGRVAANRMHALRARRSKLVVVTTTKPQDRSAASAQTISDASIPWD